MAKLTKRERKEQKKLEYQEILAKQKRNQKLSKFGIWAGVAAVLALSVWGLVALSNTTQNGETQEITAPEVSQSDITIGSSSAKVSLTEYADFQCPSCAAYHPLVNQLLSEFDGKIIFAYRFFPLSQIHKNAIISAQAGYAAHKQEKFKEMYDMLFDHQNDWANLDNPEETFIQYAREIGLNAEVFKKDLSSNEAKNIVQKSYQEGVSIGINSTPTFFLNNKKIPSPGTYDNFKKLIEDELAKK